MEIFCEIFGLFKPIWFNFEPSETKNFKKKRKNFLKLFWWETDKLSKNYLFFRKLTQIPVISRVLKLNSHTNSQRYIRFNFDLTNNYFRLKSEIFIKFQQNWKFWVQNWKFGVLPNLTSRVQTHRKLSFWKTL